MAQHRDRRPWFLGLFWCPYPKRAAFADIFSLQFACHVITPAREVLAARLIHPRCKNFSGWGNDMAGELQRENICKGCPFWIGTPKEAQEPGTPIPMLCHESGCHYP